jgi:hypothetical protein
MDAIYDRCRFCQCWVVTANLRIIRLGLLINGQLRNIEDVACADSVACIARTKAEKWGPYIPVGEQRPEAEWFKCLSCDAARKTSEVDITFVWDEAEDGSGEFEWDLEIVCADINECHRLNCPPYYP